MIESKLHIIAGPDQGRSFALRDAAVLIVGRGSASDTQVNDPAISRRHCLVEVQDQEVWLVDLDSSSGTFWHGNRISRKKLAHGDVFQIGDTHIRLDGLHELDASTIHPQASGPPVVDLRALIGKALGKYRLNDVVAAGNSGMIFKATDMEKERQAAIKVLTPDFMRSEEQKDRFVRAMKTMLPVRHENIVRLYAAGKNGPYCWASMEWIEGEDLMQLIDRLGVAGILDWREVWRMVVHIGRALHYGAEKKIVHRNLTPTNILRRSADKVCMLGDFMFAKALEGFESRQITRPGHVVGDIPYLAPERTRGEAVDARSDIYGLAATAYSLVTGRAPFEDKTPSGLLKQVQESLPQCPSVFQPAMDSNFADLLLRAMAKKPGDRPGTPAKLLHELEQIGRFHCLEAAWSGWQ